jgi:hypothetical protein
METNNKLKAHIALLRTALLEVNRETQVPFDPYAWKAIEAITYKALDTTPSNAYQQVRAKVLEEAAAFVYTNPLLTHMETAEAIRALKDKPS